MTRPDRIIRDGRIRKDRAAYIDKHGKVGAIEYLAKKYGLTRGGMERVLYGAGAKESSRGEGKKQGRKFYWWLDATDGKPYYGTHPYDTSDTLIGPVDDVDMCHSTFSDGTKFRVPLRLLTKEN